MRYLSLPHGLQPSAICLGAGGFGGDIAATVSFAMLDAFVAAGGNCLDSAKVYCDWLPGERSVSEKTIGRWMKQRKNRQRMIVATKGAHPDLQTMHIPRLAPADITADLEASLSHLQIETIDLYWLHRDDPARPVGEILETMQECVRAGKIRCYGCSNWRLERIQQAQAYAARHGLDGFVASQPLWNLGLPDMDAIPDKTVTRMDTPMWQYHRQVNWPALPYSSQANGLFNRLTAGSLDRMNPSLRGIYHLPENLVRFDRLQQLGRTTGLGVTQIVLGYLAGQPFPVVPIVGCRTPAQLQDSLSATDTVLTPDQIRFLLGTADI